MKINISLFASIVAGVSLAATPQVKNVKAFQQYPWGKMYISYEVVGDVAANLDGDNPPRLLVLAEDKDSGQVYGEVSDGEKHLTGDTGTAPGVHKIVWDVEGQGLAIDSSKITIKVKYVFEGYLFLVIDLSSGTNASSYPVRYLVEQSSGVFNTDEYKSEKMVLRLIEPGRIPTREATLTKPYYIGIFEVTQRQYELVMGINPCSSSSDGVGDCYPVYSVSYDMIRGASSGAGWPISSAVDPGSFIGTIREKTGIPDFDLPTEAQWEYACRAGTTTTFSYGDAPDEKYMWYIVNNYSSYAHLVGTKLSNGWGLYDMHGNVEEWCLDWCYGSLAGDDPTGPSLGEYRILRGGCGMSPADYCASSRWNGNAPSRDSAYYGFRLARTLSY